MQRLGGLSYFAGAEKKDDRVLVPDLGSLTSIYDSHFAYLAKKEAGHYPEWDEHHPIHFVGHSAGAQVVRVLQQMLADKAFKGCENTSENWVLSITSLSGALNGTTRTYLEGMQPEDGKSLMPVCLLQLCRIGVIMDEDWWGNDGALNTISMTQPRFPVEHPSRFVIKDSDCQPLQPGIWYTIVFSRR
ncbi:hypothetical protein K7X08_026087 [Anisodus acutangulus]|uniref:Uncharacterized protein n=1 Tax=Anisodus acutangulus TaxID=402998 RepID=A0A9Q1RUT7_9SOLA|nr:hypothetical protein K7X08_026087 [Anisodus acutangulus]